MPESLQEWDWTVSGFWHETWERFTWHTSAPSADYAETLAHQYAKSRGGHLGITGVYEGHLQDYSTALWVDRSCSTQEMMDVIRRDTGNNFVPFGM